MRSFIFLMLLHISFMCHAQLLDKHKWEHRVLLIISEESAADQLPDLYLQQIQSIKDSLNGYIERKLVIYTVFPTRYDYSDLVNDTAASWIEHPTLYESYNKENKPFKIVLIGLDGSVKEQRTTLLLAQELFKIIDGMSLRRAELRSKN